MSPSAQPQDSPERLEVPGDLPASTRLSERMPRLSKAGTVAIIAGCVILSACMILVKILLNPSFGTPNSTTLNGPQLQTAAGMMVISKVELGERFPPSCSPGPTCLTPKSGYQILALYLQRKDGGNIDDVSREFFGEAIPLLEGPKDPGTGYVTLSDGTKSQLAVLQIVGSRLVLVFSVSANARDFTLTWPNNPPIALK
jgi:hypothetical protein